MRAQLNEGMKRSQVGVIVLSQAFFSPQKYWAPAEFDSWIDAGPLNRVVVIWLDVDKQAVREWSPIAATLFARRHGAEHFLDTVSGDVRKKMIDTGMYAAHLRSALEKSLRWVRPPEFFLPSLAAIENDPSWVFPNSGFPPAGRAVPLPEVFSRPTDFVGTPIIVSGHIRAIQLLARSGGVQEFAFQLTTSDPRYAGYHLQCSACKISDNTLALPEPPSSVYLANVGGWVVGRGGVSVGPGGDENAILFFASNVLFTDLSGSNGQPMVAWLGR